MIDPALLLADLTDVVDELERDLRERTESVADIGAKLRVEHQAARQRERTAEAYEVWRDARITQVAVAWVLSCVFVRFLEDNGLIAQPYLSGPGDRLTLARDHHTLYFRANPKAEDPQYLQDVFRDVANLPTMTALLDDQHNPLWTLTPSADGAKKLIEFWHKKDTATGELVHDFSDPEWNTRFLGDLYQDLSEAAQKRYALKQTPDFVLAFILDRALNPAIHEFGFRNVRVIDPTCGSGHFLLEAFRRLFARYQQAEPGMNARELAQRVLDQVFGVDLNPYAIAIARFRLVVEALRVARVVRLDQAPDYKTNLAVGDSLLHGPRPRRIEGRQLLAWTEEDKLAHVYDTEDADELRRILGQPYHVVVGNPPYITPKDPALNAAYRSRFESCHRQYSLGVPFTERFFDLVLAPETCETAPAGYLGMITANSFMKREFGKVLIERVLPRFDLTHVIDMSGAYLPGHGTPTVILFARNRRPTGSAVRAVRGIRGEPTTPDDPSNGLVWTAIVQQIDRPGSESAFVSASDVERTTYAHHPWSVGGGGAAELKAHIEDQAETTLAMLGGEVGRTTHTGEDDAFCVPPSVARTRGWTEWVVPVVDGEDVRDYQIRPQTVGLFPYDRESGDQREVREPAVLRHLWFMRTVLRNRIDFGHTPESRGLRWFDHSMFFAGRYRRPLGIAFSEIASHNHFVLDYGGKVFKQTAPVIKLPLDATEDDHLRLLGLLNSSTTCFWMKQVSQQKQMTGGDGVRIEFLSKVPYQFAGTQLKRLPIPERFTEPELAGRLLAVAREINRLGHEAQDDTALRAVEAGVVGGATKILGEWGESQQRNRERRARSVFLQEELDWIAYAMFGLADHRCLAHEAVVPPETFDAGQRPFEIRAQASDDAHLVPAEVPVSWPEALKALWSTRMSRIQDSPELRLLESPMFKRRWIGRQGLFNHGVAKDELADACWGWLLDRLEHSRYWPEPQLTTCARLADRVGRDAEFRQVAELYRGRADFELTDLIVELVEDEAVPFLGALRYSESGLRKHALWERAWDHQRREDAGEKIEIDVPPKYASADFSKTTYRRLRGNLDVPKERFILYPLAGTDADPTPVIGWAGWNHLERAKALAETIVARRDQEAWGAEQVAPLLAGLAELLPWVRQWHNDPDATTGERAGEVFAQFLEEQARSLGLTPEDLPKWTPPAGAGRKPRGRKKKA